MTISILGCGWLGLPLAEYLRDQGHLVKGSTTSPEKLELLKGKNIIPYLLKFDPELTGDEDINFWEADVLVINIPPNRSNSKGNDFFHRQVKAMTENITSSSISFVIFVSSTSVYPAKQGVVAEMDAEEGKAARDSGNKLLKAEELLRSQTAFETTVIRPGGLYGYDRHPVNSLAGRQGLERGNAPINLIHRDDCINIIHHIIEEQITGEVFNGVSDGHPPRKMYYPAAAERMNVNPPTFKDDDGEGYKIVSNRKVKQVLGYTFKYPNPMDF